MGHQWINLTFAPGASQILLGWKLLLKENEANKSVCIAVSSCGVTWTERPDWALVPEFWNSNEMTDALDNYCKFRANQGLCAALNFGDSARIRRRLHTQNEGDAHLMNNIQKQNQ